MGTMGDVHCLYQCTAGIDTAGRALRLCLMMEKSCAAQRFPLPVWCDVGREFLLFSAWIMLQVGFISPADNKEIWD